MHAAEMKVSEFVISGILMLPVPVRAAVALPGWYVKQTGRGIRWCSTGNVLIPFFPKYAAHE